jgi:hypothetical protein
MAALRIAPLEQSDSILLPPVRHSGALAREAPLAHAVVSLARRLRASTSAGVSRSGGTRK